MAFFDSEWGGWRLRGRGIVVAMRSVTGAGCRAQPAPFAGGRDRTRTYEPHGCELSTLFMYLETAWLLIYALSSFFIRAI